MKNSFWPSLAVLLIVLNSILLFLRIESVKTIKNQNDELLVIQQSTAEDINIQSWFSLLPFEVNGKKLDPTVKVANTDNKEVSLKVLIGPRGKWVLRYFNESCLSCYDESIQMIRDIVNKKDDSAFAVLTNFTSINELRNFKSRTHFKCDVVSVDSLYEWTAETQALPYLMRIEENGLISSCFLIQKNNLSLLEQTLKLIFDEN